MKYDAFNLNFIKPEELRSPSPVRLRVMMPLLAILACLGMCVWWGALFTQLLIERADVSSIKAEIAALTPRFNEVSGQQAQCNELSGELAQLEFYRAGVRHLGEPLAKLAEVIPIKLQLKELKITPPAPQNLANPNKKLPPLWGPASNVETQKIVFAGLAESETPVLTLRRSLSDPIFGQLCATNRPAISGDWVSQGRRFEFVYTMPGRSFAK